MWPHTAERLMLRLAEVQATDRLPSVVAGVVRDGGVVGRPGASRASHRRPTPYRIGSITKVFVGACVMRLRNDGLLALTDPVDKHLPARRSAMSRSPNCSRTRRACR